MVASKISNLSIKWDHAHDLPLPNVAKQQQLLLNVECGEDNSNF